MSITLIDPKVELFSEENVTPEQHIARCARVCYGNEDKPHTPEQDKKLVEGLIKNKHLSMLRHASKYFSIPDDSFIDNPCYHYGILTNIPYNSYLYDDSVLSTNLQEFEYGVTGFTLAAVKAKPLSQEEMLYGIKMANPAYIDAYRLTFCITTQIATSRELNRKSPNNIAERSTRYCSSKDNLLICKPWWYYKVGIEESTKTDYINAMVSASESYNTMLKNDFKPEDARGVLPLDTATKVIYTYTIREWKEILNLRLYDKAGKAHQNCKVVMAMVRDQINQFLRTHIQNPRGVFV